MRIGRVFFKYCKDFLNFREKNQLIRMKLNFFKKI